MQNRFDLVTFDCYGTLIDWDQGIIEAFRDEANTQGASLDPKALLDTYLSQEINVEQNYKPYRQVLDETATRVASRLGLDASKLKPHFLSKRISDWRPFRDTNPSLERLAKTYKLGILSNIDDDLLASTRRHFTVEFDLIVTAEQVRSYKPGYAHFEEARRRAGKLRQLHAAQSYFHDVIPAVQLGIPVAWVNRKNEARSAGGPRPDYEVQDLKTLADLLQC